MILALCRQDSLVSIAILWSFGFIRIPSSINSLFYQSAKGIYFFKMLEYTFDFTMTNYYGYLSFWLTPPDPFWLCVVCWWLHCFCNLGPPNFRLGYNNVHILSLTILGGMMGGPPPIPLKPIQLIISQNPLHDIFSLKSPARYLKFAPDI